MRNPRNKRRPRATPDGSHATGITPVSVLQRETAGFNNHDSLATINSVTRLYGVHLHYSSYLRSFYTLHDLLPPHAVKLLDSRTEIRENPGISPGGFIFIYARLVAYRVLTRHTVMHAASYNTASCASLPGGRSSLLRQAQHKSPHCG